MGFSTTPLSIEELRATAIANRSVNVHLASHWSLRWHDPFWIAAWERWNAAKRAWGHVWPGLDWNQYGEVYKPVPAGILDPTQRAIAQEYLDARTAYHATNELYPEDEPPDPYPEPKP